MENRISVILFVAIIAISMIYAQPNAVIAGTITEQEPVEVAVCSEQLEICIDGYNNLLEDFRNDINCRGTAFDSLKKNNINLSIERDDYQDEAESLKNYRSGFYLILILFIIFMIIYFREILKKDNNLDKKSKKLMKKYLQKKKPK